MIDIRPLTPDLVVTADELLQAAFGKPEPRLDDLLRCLEFQPDGFYLAYQGDDIAGMGGAIDYGEFAYIGMMAVHPRYQRRGVARGLMQFLLEWIEARGVPSALLDASAMGYPLYQAMGFVDVEDAAAYHQPQAAIIPPPPDSIARMAPEDLPDVAEFDRPIFGADRSELLATLLRDFPETAWTARSPEGALTGFLFARGHRIGPWTAERPQDAEMLLQAVLSTPLQGTPTLVTPASNRAAHSLLVRYGFHRLSACRHMRRGLPLQAERRDLVFAQTSYAAG